MSMGKFIVIDTETTWSDKVMSLGAVVADAATMQPVDSKYYIIDPEYRAGGMYSGALLHKKAQSPVVCSRAEAMDDLKKCCSGHNIREVFAYNALFDKGHLPELSGMNWHDIMKLAAYIQYNPMIPRDAPLCSTGRLKSGYGVQSMLRILTGNCGYYETHNALLDALDELKIMCLLGHPADRYGNL